MVKQLDTRTRLLTEKPLKLMFSLSIPGILGMVVVALYNLMDSIFVGQMVGSIAVSSTPLTLPTNTHGESTVGRDT